MDAATLLKYEGRAPRYTSYPTAPHFVESVDAQTYGAWLESVPWGSPLSLYVHIPFCAALCWFCGCQTQVANRYDRISAYAGWLRREMALVVRRLGPGRAGRSRIFISAAARPPSSPPQTFYLCATTSGAVSISSATRKSPSKSIPEIWPNRWPRRSPKPGSIA
jgi:hypothetical protein